MDCLQETSSDGVAARPQHNPARRLKRHSSIQFNCHPRHAAWLHNPRLLLDDITGTLIQHTNHSCNTTRHMHPSSMHIHSHRQHMFKRQDLCREVLDIRYWPPGIAKQICYPQMYWVDFCEVKGCDLTCYCPICGCIVDFNAFDGAGFFGWHGNEGVAYLTAASFDTS